jgi:hypothetical protein
LRARAIIEQIAANNQRIEQLRRDLLRDMNAGFDGMMAELIDRGTPD